MGYHNGSLWICDTTDDSTGPFDLHRVNTANGEKIQSYTLKDELSRDVHMVTSLEWVGNDLWICYAEFNTNQWVIRKYIFNGESFTPGDSYSLPSSVDWNSIWSINIAWDGNLLWVQEKGSSCIVNVYKIDLADGTIVETIPAEQFGKNLNLGLGDISDICFSDGYLWLMDDDNPIFSRIDPKEPIFPDVINYTFDKNMYSFAESAKYNGMVKYDNRIYFMNKNGTVESHTIYIARIDNELQPVKSLMAILQLLLH